MRRFILFLALTTLSLAGADLAFTDGMANGRSWIGLGGGDRKVAVMLKFVYLSGLADGLQQAQGELIPEIFPKATPGQEEKAASITPSLLPKGTDFATMIATLDRIYTDPQNLDIPIPMAARIGRAELEGRAPEELAERVKRLRTLYSILRQLDSLENK